MLTPKQLVKGAALTGAAANVYSAPTATSANLHAASVNNPTASAVVVNLYVALVGSTPGAAQLSAKRTIAAGAVTPIAEVANWKIEPGYALFADGNGMFLNVFGTEYLPE